MAQPRSDLRVSLLAIPDTYMSCLSGLLDTLTVARDVADGPIPFELEIVAPPPGRDRMHPHAVSAHRTLDVIDRTDIVIIPASVMDGEKWVTGRYPRGSAVAEGHVRAWGDPLFGLLGCPAAGRDRTARRPGCDDALDARAHLPRELPRGSSPARAGIRHQL
jgi:hypothetical protein